MLGLPLITTIVDLGVLVDADTTPCVPILLCQPSPRSLHHRPIVSPCAHLPFIVDLAPQASHRPSPRSPRADTSRLCTSRQGLVFPLSPSLVPRFSFSTPVSPRLDSYYTDFPTTIFPLSQRFGVLMFPLRSSSTLPSLASLSYSQSPFIL